MPRFRAYRRKRTYTRRPRRNMNRRKYRGTRRNKMGQKVFMYKRYSGAFGSLVLNNITETYAGYNFSLSDLPSVADFTNLYDMYKINRVKVTFIPMQTQNVSLSSVNNAPGYVRFFSAIDYNDDTAPTSVNQIREYETCKWTTIYKPHVRYLKPRINDSANNYTVPGNPWISCASPNINYFGLKVAVEAIDSTVATTMEMPVEVTYYISFKNVR